MSTDTEEESSAYMNHIIAALHVQGSRQRYVMHYSAVISGGAAHFGGWIFPTGGNILSSLFYLLCSMLFSYIAIGLTIIAVGSIVTSPTTRILDQPDDRLCAEDVGDIVDRLTALFVPITVSVIAVGAVLLTALRNS